MSVKQLWNESLTSGKHLPQKMTNRIPVLKNDFATEESNLRSELGKAVKAVRSGESELSEIEPLLQRFDKFFSSQNYEELESLRINLRQRLNMIAELQKSGIHCLDKENSFITEITKQAAAKDAYDLYVLFIDDTFYQGSQDQIIALQLLVRFACSKDKDNDIKTMLVDSDLQPNSNAHGISKLPNLQKYRKGERVAEDLVTVWQLDMGKDLFKIKMARRGDRSIPVRKEILRIFCPKSSTRGACNRKKRLWVCSDCQCYLHINLEDTTNVFCSENCGQSRLSELLFRCNDSYHGIHYEAFQEKDEGDVKQIVESIADKVRNILILGETGVGKSTWINGLANYIHYRDLEQALEPNSKLFVPIPTQYEVNDDKGGYKKIPIRDDSYIPTDQDNECFVTGASSTQMPITHSLCMNDFTYKLIDTPGMGDVRGVEQDKLNMQSILAVLAAIDNLHCICILMKPNITRLTPSFTYCIMELLTHLHKSSSQNIVFCFTNTRSTFYEAPETLKCLKAFFQDSLKNKEVKIDLNPSKTFFFDNEGFRLLALAKNGVQFKENVIKDFSGSWSKSSEETGRLLDLVEPTIPHKVEDTISLNEAKQLIMNMAVPLQNVCVAISNTLKKIGNYQDDKNKTEKEVHNFKQRLKFEGDACEITPLLRPYTACTHINCTATKVLTNNVTTHVYKSCHKPCSVQDVPVQGRGDARLTRCLAFKCNGETCDCGHTYHDHMHMITETKFVKKTFDNEDAMKKMNAASTEAEKMQIVIDNENTLKEELEGEHKAFFAASASFAWFLTKNAITPFNDYIDDYISLAIKTTENCGGANKDDELEKVCCWSFEHILNGLIIGWSEASEAINYYILVRFCCT
jgi:GTPase SAR1 family protein